MHLYDILKWIKYLLEGIQMDELVKLLDENLDYVEYSEVAEPPTLLKWSHLFHYEEPVN